MFRKASPLEVKAEPNGMVSGIAWSFAHAPDAVGDHVLASAFRYGDSLPMMLEHKSSIGRWSEITVDSYGLRVNGQIDKTTRDGREAAAKAADGSLSGLSIGFSGEYQKSGNNRIFVSADLAEVSLVARPANAGSRVTALKSLNECDRISDVTKLLKQQLRISKRQADIVAREIWPLFKNTDQDTDELVGLLSNVSLR